METANLTRKRMTRSCHTSTHVAAPCKKCHAYPATVHVVSERTVLPPGFNGEEKIRIETDFWCAEHCKSCSPQVSGEWADDSPKTVEGTQVDFW